MIKLNFNKNEKGQALILVFFLLLVVGTLAGALSHMLNSRIQVQGHQEKSSSAFFLAQSAIERAKIEAVNDPALSGWQPCADDDNSACWYQELSDGWYKYNITNIGSNARLLEAKGRVLDLGNKVLAERQLAVEVDIVLKKRRWSWREH